MKGLRRVLLGACAAAVAAAWLVSAAEARAAATPAYCKNEHLKCFRIEVPLDWTHRRPSTTSLWVNEYVPRGPHRGVLFLVAGGPGQPSSREFNLSAEGFWANTFPGYTLVAFDPRGTGRSDPLTCRSLNEARCAAELGLRRNYYSTADNAMDLDAVRKAVGAQRIVVYGVSYGTAVAVTYARMFPRHAARLLLDSMTKLGYPVGADVEVGKQIPATLRRLCARACSKATARYASNAVYLARTLTKHPIVGRVRQRDGTFKTITLDGATFLYLVMDSDLSQALQAELPAAVAAARHGDTTALLRLEQVDGFGFTTPAPPPYNAVQIATTCDDGPFPWGSDAPVGGRAALLAKTRMRFPARLYGVFGALEAANSAARACLRWPPSTRVPPTVPAAYPNIPVLAISGSLDLRTPTVFARSVLAHFPRGHLLIVANTGHSALSATMSPCLSGALRSWLAGRTVPRICDVPLRLNPIGSLESRHAGAKPSPARTLALVTWTLRDAEASADLGGDVAGIQAGMMRPSDYGYELSGYSLSGGIDLDGYLEWNYASDAAWSYEGGVRVIFRGTTIGSLAVEPDGTLDGTLDSRPVVGSRIVPDAPAPVRMRPWSSWTPPSGSPTRVSAAIAEHVGASYKLGYGGLTLAEVTSRAADEPGAPPPIALIELDRSGDDESAQDATYAETSFTRIYTLCGAGPKCSLPGTPTVVRARLVAREALELALYTFEFEPAETAVVVLATGQVGADTNRSAFYFRRNQLQGELREPLSSTLPLATPPLPDVPDRAEQATIDRLAYDRERGTAFHRIGASGFELELY